MCIQLDIQLNNISEKLHIPALFHSLQMFTFVIQHLFKNIMISKSFGGNKNEENHTRYWKKEETGNKSSDADQI